MRNLLALAVMFLLMATGASGQDTSPIVHEGIVDAPLNKVWKAWTTSEGLRSWLAPHAAIAIRKMWSIVYFEALDSGHTKVREVSLGFDGSDESQKMRGFFLQGNATTLAQLQKHFSTAGK